MLDRANGRPISICLVTGSPQSGRCGIHDFTMRLAGVLPRSCVDVEVVDHRDWSAGGTLRLVRELAGAAHDVVHMQYPMIVGWRSLGPHLLGFLSRARHVVTLHEFTTFDRLRQASLRALAASVDRIVMTTAYETAQFLQRSPRARSKTSVIPIGSNIPFRASAEPPRERRTVVFFGQIKPMKGLEAFIELVRLAHAARQPWDFQVIGAPVAWAGDYLAAMRSKAGGTRLEWLLDRSDEETATLLSRASAAYLAYPDGASERRGSLIAALGNGLPVVTNAGPAMPPQMDGAVLLAADPAEAYVRLQALFCDPELERRMRQAGPTLVQACTWSSIADRYVALYRQIARTPAVAEAAA